MSEINFQNCEDVRLAAPEDFYGILDLMRVACEEDAQHKMSEEKVVNMLMKYYDKQGALLAVIGDVGAPVAYILMVVDFLWFSDDAQLLELSLFVHPDHRKSTFAKQLMQFGKQASNGMNLDLTIGVFSHQRTEAKVRLYERQFPRVGAYFCYRPTAASNN